MRVSSSLRDQLAAGGLGALGDLLRGFLAGVELALQGLQALLEFLFDAVQRGCLFFGQALVGTGFGVHLPGEDGVLFLFAGDQFGELLLAFEGGIFAADFGAQLVNFALQLAHSEAGVGGRQERAGAETGTGLAE